MDLVMYPPCFPAAAEKFSEVVGSCREAISCQRHPFAHASKRLLLAGARLTICGRSYQDIRRVNGPLGLERPAQRLPWRARHVKRGGGGIAAAAPPPRHQPRNLKTAQKE